MKNDKMNWYVVPTTASMYGSTMAAFEFVESMEILLEREWWLKCVLVIFIDIYINGLKKTTESAMPATIPPSPICIKIGGAGSWDSQFLNVLQCFIKNSNTEVFLKQWYGFFEEISKI